MKQLTLMAYGLFALLLAGNLQAAHWLGGAAGGNPNDAAAQQARWAAEQEERNRLFDLTDAIDWAFQRGLGIVQIPPEFYPGTALGDQLQTLLNDQARHGGPGEIFFGAPRTEYVRHLQENYITTDPRMLQNKGQPHVRELARLMRTLDMQAGLQIPLPEDVQTSITFFTTDPVAHDTMLQPALNREVKRLRDELARERARQWGIPELYERRLTAYQDFARRHFIHLDEEEPPVTPQPAFAPDPTNINERHHHDLWQYGRGDNDSDAGSSLGGTAGGSTTGGSTIGMLGGGRPGRPGEDIAATLEGFMQRLQRLQARARALGIRIQ